MRPGVFIALSLIVGAIVGPALIAAAVWVGAVWAALAGVLR